jgi:hypothetical protein
LVGVGEGFVDVGVFVGCWVDVGDGVTCWAPALPAPKCSQPRPK